jgi:hypothetical protein
MEKTFKFIDSDLPIELQQTKTLEDKRIEVTIIETIKTSTSLNELYNIKQQLLNKLGEIEKDINDILALPHE